MSPEDTPLLPHGGYRKLRSYKVAEAVYDATVVFCRRFFPRDRRMTDQMVQAARSGVRNISEGSGAAATSRKSEMKLTNVARASLSDELLPDYESFLRQNGLRVWSKESREARAMRERLREDRAANLPPAPAGWPISWPKPSRNWRATRWCARSTRQLICSNGRSRARAGSSWRKAASPRTSIASAGRPAPEAKGAVGPASPTSRTSLTSPTRLTLLQQDAHDPGTSERGARANPFPGGLRGSKLDPAGPFHMNRGTSNGKRDTQGLHGGLQLHT